MSNTPGPAYVALSIWQGQTFDTQLLLQDASGNPINLTGYTAQMMLRNDPADPLPILTWGTATGEITLGGTAGTLQFGVTPAATQALPTGNEPQSWAYDILITNATTPPFSQRVAYGLLTVVPAVTRPPVPSQGRPVAAFTAVGTGFSVVFTDTSTDAAANVASVVLAFGDGAYAALAPGSSVTHVYASAGTYVVSQGVVDTAGSVASSQQSLVLA